VLYWILVALWHFTPLSALGYFATIAVLGLLTATMFWFVVRVRLAAPRVPLWIVLPVAWTTLEWLVGHLGDVRFPWLGLGTSLADAPVLVQWADIAARARGHAVGRVVQCRDRRSVSRIRETGNGIRGPLLRFGAPLLASILMALGYGAWRMKTLPVRDVGVVAMVQPNEAFMRNGIPRTPTVR